VIVSGIFIKQLDRDKESTEDMFDYYKHVRGVSEKQGYAVIQGLKQIGIPCTYSRLQELAASNRPEDSGMQVDEESKNDTEVPIYSKDLIKMAKESSNFVDFRLQRILIDAVKEKQIKTYKDTRVLDSLTRLLLFESSRLLTDPKRSKELV